MNYRYHILFTVLFIRIFVSIGFADDSNLINNPSFENVVPAKLPNPGWGNADYGPIPGLPDWYVFMRSPDCFTRQSGNVPMNFMTGSLEPVHGDNYAGISFGKYGGQFLYEILEGSLSRPATQSNTYNFSGYFSIGNVRLIGSDVKISLRDSQQDIEYEIGILNLPANPNQWVHFQKEFKIDIDANFDRIVLTGWEGTSYRLGYVFIDSLNLIQKSNLIAPEFYDFESAEHCESKEYEFYIRNTSDVDIKLLSQEISGTDKSLFRFKLPFVPATLSPGELFTRIVLFEPGDSEEGTKKAEIITTIQIGNNTEAHTTQLRGYKANIDYEVEIPETFEAETMSDTIMQVTVRNRSRNILTILEAELLTNREISFYEDPVGMKIPSDAMRFIRLKCNPEDTGPFKDTLRLKFTSMNCEYEYEEEITCFGFVNSVVWAPDTIVSYDLEELSIPVYAYISSNYDKTLDASFRTDIKILKDIYEAAVNSSIEDNNTVVSLQNDVLLDGVTVIDTIHGQLVESDVKYSPVQITDFAWDDPYIKFTVIDGSITINPDVFEADVSENIYYESLEYCDEKYLSMEVKNTGNRNITILSQEITGNNPEFFTFKNSFQETELGPDESFTRIILFNPGDSPAGIKHADLITKIDMNGETKEFNTKLSGLKTEISYAINIPEIDDIDTDNESEFSIGLKNTGDYSFTVTKAELADSIHFKINSNPVGKQLQPDELIEIEMLFSPEFAGDLNDVLKLEFEGQSCIYEEDIDLNATGLVPDVLQADVDREIDFGTFEYCIDSSLTLTVTNNGNVPFTVISQEFPTYEYEYEFAEGFIETELAPGEKYEREIHFNPVKGYTQFHESKVTTKIRFTEDSTADFITKLKTEIFHYDFEIIYPDTVFSEIKNDYYVALKVVNNNDADAYLHSVGFKFGINILYEETGDVLLPAGDTTIVNLNFKPLQTGHYSDSIGLRIKTDCNYLYHSELFGTGIINTMTWLPDTSAKWDRGTLCIPVYSRILTQNVESLELNFKGNIALDPYCFNPYTESEIIGNEQIISIDNHAKIYRGANKIESICGKLMLASKSKYPVIFKEFEWDDPFVYDTTINGSITTDGVCIQNLKSLAFFEHTDLTLKQVQDDRAEITVSSEVCGRFTLNIYSVAGVLQESTQWTGSGNIQSRQIIFGEEIDCPSGAYVAVLISPDKVISKMFYILK